MGAETYALITGCYALGCYLSYRAGRKTGMNAAVKSIVEDVAEIYGGNISTVATKILEHNKRKLARKMVAK